MPFVSFHLRLERWTDSEDYGIRVGVVGGVKWIDRGWEKGSGWIERE